jgi:hypothetical protein
MSEKAKAVQPMMMMMMMMMMICLVHVLPNGLSLHLQSAPFLYRVLYISSIYINKTA